MESLVVSAPWLGALVSARRTVVAGPLAPLAASLRADLVPLLEADEIRLPPEKARLTRVGGRCPVHGTLLHFDPYRPRDHRCLACGITYTDEEHYRWWIMNYQLWLSERAVHAAALGALTDDAACLGLARRILAASAEAWERYPNRDNVLGPTRPFFSTYLESIWTLQLSMALMLVETTGSESVLGGQVRDRVLAPSADLIGSYDEGASNRQVWNNAALLATGLLCDRPQQVARAIEGRSGLLAHLSSNLLPDGSWYEGENYHQFAHRGLWYGVWCAGLAGAAIPPLLQQRFGEAFAVPFLTALPDFTFPARRDSQYAVSLRQWRYAESCELGLARGDDPRLASALAELYRPDVPPGPTGRAEGTAEAERNAPAVRLDRSALGWKSLLHARPELPPLQRQPLPSIHLEHQGYAIFRRQHGRVYVALDYGTPGGGHGHPDRLNLWLVQGPGRFLEDVGTGSYVERALFWYRSTWAHNAPLVGGRSQPHGAGVLKAWEERDGTGWIEAEFEIVPGRTRVTRRLVVRPEYLVDELRWAGADRVTLALPWHVDGEVRGREWHEVADGSQLQGSGQEFMTDLCTTPGRNGDEVVASVGGESARGWMFADLPYRWGRAEAPGPPGGARRRFLWVEGDGHQGTFRSVWAWSPDVLRVEGREDGLTVGVGGRSDEHVPGSEWLVVERSARGALERRLGGRRVALEARAVTGETAAAGPSHILASGRPWALELGERHYRRSELPWREAGAPEATLRVAAGHQRVDLDLEVRKAPLHFAPRRETNPLDNEDPDINSDGVQLYLSLPDSHAWGSWLLVPEESPHVRVTPRDGGGALPPLSASWRLTPDGYRVRMSLARGASGIGIDRHFMLNVVINEISPDRERRRGQLVATGAQDEWVYLRGDREDPRRMIAFEIVDG